MYPLMVHRVFKNIFGQIYFPDVMNYFSDELVFDTWNQSGPACFPDYKGYLVFPENIYSILWGHAIMSFLV